MNQREYGFTLLELVIVISIAMILVSVGIPSYQQVSEQNKLATETNNFLVSLNLARSESVKRSRQVAVCKSADPMASSPACVSSGGWEQGWVVFIDTDRDGVIDTTETVINVQARLNGKVEIAGDTNFSHRITFNPSGAAEGNGGDQEGDIKLCNGEKGRTLSINRVGRVSLSKSTCTVSES